MKNTYKMLPLSFGMILILIALTTSCKKEAAKDPVQTPEQRVEVAQDAFVATLVATPPTKTDISERIKSYMLNNPKEFFGATVTLLDSLKIATYSPYWYRSGNELQVTDLNADATYHINDQLWFRQPIDGGVSIWTKPYFDEGGGNIWMKTRSVPVSIKGKIIAVVTTDLAIK